MPWQGTRPQHQALWQALDKLRVQDGIKLGRIARAINADPQARATASVWGQHDGSPLIDATTLKRWHKGGPERLRSAQALKKTTVYEFFERSSSFQTALYWSQVQLPPGLLSYAAQHGARLARPLQQNLRVFDGNYRIFRPAWTIRSLNRRRVLVSRLKIETADGFTRFREEQDYTDPAAQGISIHEIDEGAALMLGANLILFGFGIDGERTKIYAAWSCYPSLRDRKPIGRFCGVMMGISGTGPHSSYPFVAYRAPEPFAAIETAIISPPHPRLSDDTLATLEIEPPQG